MDPIVLEKLKKKYPDYDVNKFVQTGDGEPRIRIRNDNYFNLVEVDVPPGCYVVSTRSCINPEHDANYNFETNKVMAFVNCDEDVCVNLLLNRAQRCVKEMLYPGAILAIKKEIPERELRDTVKNLMEISEVPKEAFILDLQQRLEELKYLIDTGKKEEALEYLEPTEFLLKVVKSL